MGYLGRQLSSGNYLKLDDISSQFNGSLTTFNLTSGGQTFYPGSAYSILVSLGGIIQEPESGYQINENQIIFAVAPQASDDFFCIVLGTALGIGVPGDGTVSGTKLTRPFNYDSGLLYLDDTNNRVGINSTAPRTALDVVGVVSATSFTGDLTGTASLASGLTGTPNITVGIITAGSLEVSGNVSIAGTLTYEDVTNVDSIGLITARNGIIVTGVATATSFSGSGSGLTGVSTNFVSAIGIQSGGVTIGAGITQLNFVGTGNTFVVNGTTLDISIQSGAGGTWASNAVGVHTTKIVGVNTTTIAGAANSEGALQVTGNVALVDGALLTDQNINTNVFIPSGKNGLLIGPVTVGAGLTVDIASGSVLVVV
jgi:hypothetical protein